MIADKGSIDIQDKNGFTLLMHLCLHFDKFHYVQLYQNILTHHPNLNLQNKNGDTALMIACDYRRFDVTELLLDSGVDITDYDSSYLSLDAQ
jgi:ankyrin repeat protein